MQNPMFRPLPVAFPWYSLGSWYRVHDTETWYNSQHLITRSISSGRDMLDPGSREKEGQNHELGAMGESWRLCLVLC